LVKHHGLFQGYYYFHFYGRDRNERDRYKDHPAYQLTVDFCERWDQQSFDPSYDTLPLSFFEPMVRKIFARKPFSVCA
jgi:predicted HD phosphohydrolase